MGWVSVCVCVCVREIGSVSVGEDIQFVQYKKHYVYGESPQR